MYSEHVHSEQTGILSDLIAFDSDGRAVWPAQHLHAALHRELGASLHAAAARRDSADSAASISPSSIATFRDLLHHPCPPMRLLWLAKDHAKLSREDRRSSMPPEVALVLYYGSIAAALLRHGRRISRLSDDDLRSGFNWAAKQPWLDAPTRKLFIDGLSALRSSLLRWHTA